MSNLTPGKKPKGGHSVRLSAYVADKPSLEAIERVRANLTAYEFSEFVGGLVAAASKELLKEFDEIVNSP